MTMDFIKPAALPLIARDSNDEGFTLIEMIVALALLALITTLLAGSMSGARQVLGMVERNTSVVTIGAVQTYMRSALLEVVAQSAGGADDSFATPFAGNQTNIQFATTYVPQGQIGGAYSVAFKLVPAMAGPTFDLIATQTLVRDKDAAIAGSGAPQLRSVLVANVVGIEFGFFGAQGDNADELQWHSVWTKQDRLPRLVRIDVQFPNGDPRTWHRLQVPLRMAD